jgi:hypothetical protein
MGLLASFLRAWRPAERRAPACWRGSAHLGRPAHAEPGHTCDALSVGVTALWPRAQRYFGTDGAIRAEVQERQGLWGKHHGEEGQPPDKEARRGLTRNCGASVERWGDAARWRSTAVEGSWLSSMTQP